MFKSLVTCLALSLSLAGAALAAGAPPAPDAALRNATEEVRGMIRDHYAEYRADQAKFYQAIDQVVVPHFDVPYIAQLVLARNWRTATPEQRARFAQAFKDMLVRSYANAMLDNYNSVKIAWQPARLAPGADDATVVSTLTRDNGQVYTIGFRVHLVNGDWKIYDLNIENISLVTNFRAQINAEIKRTSLDDVIARMEKGEFKSSPVQSRPQSQNASEP
ncbi:MAG: ABC transporter substrate-binding protein [Nevskia sp.]|nr:ABC transporter substrate-binding protein [Nevskia sp.]